MEPKLTVGSRVEIRTGHLRGCFAVVVDIDSEGLCLVELVLGQPGHYSSDELKLR